MKVKGSKLVEEIKSKFLEENLLGSDPFVLAKEWYGDALESEIKEPTAASLATCGIDGKPSVRFILLKSIIDEGFVFYTNYKSRKADQLKENPNVAMALYWSEFERQMRIEGTVEILSKDISDEYYDSRPEGSKIGAWASPQSRIIPGRSYLDNLKNDFDNAMTGKTIDRPDFWGGYLLKPNKIEFWKAREDRLHDRIEYVLEDGIWKFHRLAP